MNKDSFCLSSSGLKNINKEDKDFIFIFGEHEVRMNNILAEFFSPLVSRLHLSDPTISSIIIDYPSDLKSNFPIFDELITEDILHLIQDLSSGSKVSINDEQSIKLLIISVLIDNEELFDELNKLFPKKINQTNFDCFLNQIQLIDNFSRLDKINNLYLSPLINIISSNLYSINENKLKKLSKRTLLSIISNKNLKIKSEDWLFDFIQSIYNDDEEEDIYNIEFYEQIIISNLSEDKFKRLLLKIKPNEMTTAFWQTICSRICDINLNEDIQLNRYAVNQYAQSVIVGGFDKYNQLNEKPNNRNQNGGLIIGPPLKLALDSSSYQSYSIYSWHSVIVTSNCSLLGIGYNTNVSISSSLPKTEINQLTEFYLRDSNGHKLTPISAVCYSCGTLYMFTKSGCNDKQLALCDKDINGGNLVFLNIGNKEPVALYGGSSYVAAISSEGEVIFINQNSVKKSPNSVISAVSLPDGEKASSVACCNDSVVVLSSKGRVFSSIIEKGSSVLNFSECEELSGQEIVCVSGVREHFLCVSKEGRVFGRGSNSNGRIGLGEETKSVSSFTKISSISEYKIRAAYAGGIHSLFETRDGKILACGCNDCGQLLLKSGASDNVYSPSETVIEGGATFCIAGHGLSIVFVDGEPPSNTPNKRIQYHQ